MFIFELVVWLKVYIYIFFFDFHHMGFSSDFSYQGIWWLNLARSNLKRKSCHPIHDRLQQNGVTPGGDTSAGKRHVARKERRTENS